MALLGYLAWKRMDKFEKKNDHDHRDMWKKISRNRREAQKASDKVMRKLEHIEHQLESRGDDGTKA